jgi:hypothetical protein
MTEILPLPCASDADLARAEARFPAVTLALRHWEMLRLRDGEARTMPTRDEIDPLHLAQSLEFLFLAEPVAPGVARLRLAGQHLSRLMGMETRGMPLCALFDGPGRQEIGHAVTQVTTHGLRALLPVHATGGLGRPALEGLLALMPLSTGPGSPSRLLGVLQTRGAIGRTPRRLSLSGPVQSLAAGTAGPVRAGRPALRVITGGRS